MMTVTLNWATRQMLTFLKLKVKKNLPFIFSFDHFKNMCTHFYFKFSFWQLFFEENRRYLQYINFKGLCDEKNKFKICSAYLPIFWEKKNKQIHLIGRNVPVFYIAKSSISLHPTICMYAGPIYRLLHYPPCSHTISLTPHHTHREYLLLYTHSHNLNPVPERKINYFWKQ